MFALSIRVSIDIRIGRHAQRQPTSLSLLPPSPLTTGTCVAKSTTSTQPICLTAKSGACLFHLNPFHFLHRFHNGLALVAMTVVRPVPVHLLAVAAAVAADPASLAELAVGRVEGDAACAAALPQLAKLGMKSLLVRFCVAIPISNGDFFPKQPLHGPVQL